MRFCLNAIFLSIFLVSCSSLKEAKESSEHFNRVATYEPYPGLPIHEYRHKSNGLRVFLIPRENTGAIAYVTSYNVGSRFELEGKTGLAHLFEHMMFRGTESFPEPFKTLSLWGGEYNAFTSRDMTVYHEFVPDRLLPEVMKFESERMRKLLITKNGFDTERGAVVSERKKSVDDSPWGRLYWELYQLAYDKHSYKTGPIGWQKDLDAASFEDALSFYKRFYAPNRANISIAGSFDIPQVLEWLDEHYGSFESQTFEEPVIPVEKTVRSYRKKVINLTSQQVLMADAVFGLSASDPKAANDLFVCVMLATEETGFLNYELVEKGIAHSISSDCFPDHDPALATIFIEANPGVSIAKLENAYNAALKKFTAWLSPERIESAKLSFLAGEWEGLRSPMSLAKKVGTSTTLAGSPLYGFDIIQNLRKLQKQDIIDQFESWKKRGKTRVFIQPKQH
ncbi:MAG: insulinase family protein [Proteobacteria bacterium]|nr:insulinase family protein [Pseudomonadota bacterium]